MWERIVCLSVSRWAAGEWGPALSTCALPPEVKGGYAILPDLQLTPHQSSQLKPCFPVIPPSSGDGTYTPLFAPVTVFDSWSNDCKGPSTNPRKSGEMCFEFSFQHAQRLQWQ